jgi:hypothetical protein
MPRITRGSSEACSPDRLCFLARLDPDAFAAIAAFAEASIWPHDRALQAPRLKGRAPGGGAMRDHYGITMPSTPPSRQPDAMLVARRRGNLHLPLRQRGKPRCTCPTWRRLL